MTARTRRRRRQPSPYRDAVNACRRQIVEGALREAGGNRTIAARALGVTATHLCFLVRHLQIDSPATWGRPVKRPAPAVMDVAVVDG